MKADLVGAAILVLLLEEPLAAILAQAVEATLAAAVIRDSVLAALPAAILVLAAVIPDSVLGEHPAVIPAA